MSLSRIFFALLLALLPTQLGMHFWPSWSIVLGRRVDYLSPTLYLTDILIVLIAISWMYESVHHLKNVREVIAVKLFENKKIFLLLLLLIAFNIFVATSPYSAVYTWVKVMEYVLFGVYVIHAKPLFSFIVSFLSIAICYSSVLAILQFLLQHSVGGPLWFLGERTFSVDTPGIARVSWYGQEFLRSYATFSHPNVLGGFLAVTLPLVVIQLSKYSVSPLSKKIFYLFTILLGYGALALTFSRSALMVGAVGLVLGFMVAYKKKLGSVTSLLALVGIGAMIILVVQTFSPLDESIIVRNQLSASAISLWSHSPLFGIGLGNFLVRLPQVLPSRTIYFLQPVHNIYLLVLAEAGIIGLSFFLWLVWRAVRRYVTNYKRQEKTDPTHVACFLSLVSLLLLGLVDHYPVTLAQGQLLFTLLLALNLSHDKKIVS